MNTHDKFISQETHTINGRTIEVTHSRDPHGHHWVAQIEDAGPNAGAQYNSEPTIEQLTELLAKYPAKS